VKLLTGQAEDNTEERLLIETLKESVETKRRTPLNLKDEVIVRASQKCEEIIRNDYPLIRNSKF